MPNTIADRIQKAATHRGYTSERSKSGVDIQKLAAATGASYEMARRYAEGVAAPPLEALDEISKWLKVSFEWLLLGRGTMEGSASPIDAATLRKCIELALDVQRIAGVTFTPKQFASLVSTWYPLGVSGS